MKILLITPENPFIRAFRRRQINNFTQLTMPHLAGFVPRQHQVTLLDERVQAVDFDAPFDLVGITCNTPNASHVYRMADAFAPVDGSWSSAGPTRPFCPTRRDPTPMSW